MDTFESKEIPVENELTEHMEQPAEPMREAAAQPQPEPQVYGPSSEQSTYRNAGVGRRESPFANSPYVMSHQSAPNQQPYQNYSPYQQHYQNRCTPEPYRYQQPRSAVPPQPPAPPQPPVQPHSEPEKKHAERPKKKHKGSALRTVVAAVLVVALVFGGCFATAFIVNTQWEKKNQQLTDSFNQQIADMQFKMQQIEEAANADAPENTGESVSGSPVSSDGGLSPSQVYAQNVDAVVMVMSYATTAGYYGGSNTATSTGSGFIISEDGYLLTNHHVIDGATSVSIMLHSGETIGAEIIGSDATNDVALLKVNATGLPFVAIGSSDDLIVGDQVAAIGNPLGELTSTMTVGYVSGKERSVTTDGTTINMIQTDAAINSGNSGGPLFNMKGEVVGITTAKYSGNSSSGASIEGIGFAIPIDDVMEIVRDLMEFGYVKSAYMGIGVKDMSTDMADIYGLPVGAFVYSIEADGPAAKAGIQVKDIIIALGDTKISNYNDLSRALRGCEPGDTTTVTIFRAGAEIELTITLIERPQNVDTPAETQPESQLPNGGSYEDWFDYYFPRG